MGRFLPASYAPEEEPLSKTGERSGEAATSVLRRPSCHYSTDTLSYASVSARRWGEASRLFGFLLLAPG